MPRDIHATQQPLVSVVVPTFNRRTLLQETVEAVLAQTYPAIELIIVDNMSVDGTEDFVHAIRDPRVRYIRSANHGIIARNRNLGVRLSRGKYIAFCDDDDIWLPRKVQEQVAAMEGDSRAGLCYTDAIVFREDEVLDPSLVKWKVSGKRFGPLLFRNFIPSSSVMLRKEVVEAEGGFDESGALAPFEDYELWLRIAHGHALAYIDEPLLRYRVHGQNWAGRYGNRQRIVVNVLRSVQRKLGVFEPLIQVAILVRTAKATVSERNLRAFPPRG